MDHIDWLMLLEYALNVIENLQMKITNLRRLKNNSLFYIYDVQII